MLAEGTLSSTLTGIWQGYGSDAIKEQFIREVKHIIKIENHNKTEAAFKIKDMADRNVFWYVIDRYKKADPGLDDPATVPEMLKELLAKVKTGLGYLKTSRRMQRGVY